MTKNRLAIAAIFKNEAPYILEWIAYHKMIGVSHFYIADNISTDGSSQILEALHQQGIITRIPFPTLNNTPPQLPAYNHIVKTAKEDKICNWLAFIDADEFLAPERMEHGLNDLFELMNDETVGAIALNWASYGSSNYIVPNDDLVINRFTYRSDDNHRSNKPYKSLVRLDGYNHSGPTPHAFVLKKGYKFIKTNKEIINDISGVSDEKCWNICRVNHYLIKSKSECITKKMARGRAVTLDSAKNRAKTFYNQPQLNSTVDKYPDWFVEQLRYQHQKLVNSMPNFITPYIIIDYGKPLRSASESYGRGYVDSIIANGNMLVLRGWAVTDFDVPYDFNVIIENYNIEIIKKIVSSRADILKLGISKTDKVGFEIHIDISHFVHIEQPEIEVHIVTKGQSIASLKINNSIPNRI
ncbi:glycosyltransferase family 2 protein [Escherichia coli]|uniref:glycosyltransferase family 2 protein n=1 Tax=Escherichia coli TaxID=562 RepID=UPI000DD82A66|nr:glycosyltransferase family 2 protein [Escherichia coli]MCA7060086.1 glycosyltransferase family 2 protein [Escherichia coli]